jgi:SAM-dependent methyltransferase
MKPTKNLFSDHASDYSKFRPHYPKELYDYLFSLVPNHEKAWDAGTGNGQVAVKLAEHFSRVIATDISATQLRLAPTRENITYIRERAESVSLENNAFDLVTVAQALHWFDVPAFFENVHQSLKNKGVLACWGYQLIEGTDDIQRHLVDFYHHVIGPYWAPERNDIDNAYTSLPIPFQIKKRFSLEVNWSKSELFGYLRTWSAVQSFLKERKTDPVTILEKDLENVLQETNTFRFPIFLNVCIKHGNS